MGCSLWFRPSFATHYSLVIFLYLIAPLGILTFIQSSISTHQGCTGVRYHGSVSHPEKTSVQPSTFYKYLQKSWRVTTLGEMIHCYNYCSVKTQDF